MISGSAEASHFHLPAYALADRFASNFRFRFSFGRITSNNEIPTIQPMLIPPTISSGAWTPKYIRLTATITTHNPSSHRYFFVTTGHSVIANAVATAVCPDGKP